MTGGDKRAVFIYTLVHAILSVMCPASGLKDVRLTVPVAVRRGGRVKLACEYDLESAQLYSVKWYRGDQEFFRFVPREDPHTQVFPHPGINVDVSLSGAYGVVLRDVQPDLTGIFKCEVSADAPLFHTVIMEAAMVVVDPPDDIPFVTVEDGRLQFSPGEILRANCTSPSSFPAANLTWFINGRQVEEAYVKRYPVTRGYKEERLLEKEATGGEEWADGEKGTAESKGEEAEEVEEVEEAEEEGVAEEERGVGEGVEEVLTVGSEEGSGDGERNSTNEEGAVVEVEEDGGVEEEVVQVSIEELMTEPEMETSSVGLEVRLDNATLTAPALPPPPNKGMEKGEPSPPPGATLLRLRCLATLFTLYRRTTEVELLVLSSAEDYSPKIAPVLHEEAQQSNRSSGRLKVRHILLLTCIFNGLVYSRENHSRSSSYVAIVTFSLVVLHEIKGCDPG